MKREQHRIVIRLTALALFLSGITVAHAQEEVSIRSGAETRSCVFSHNVEGGARAYFCAGNPAWIASTVTNTAGQTTWVLVSPKQGTNEPIRLSVNEVRKDSKLLYGALSIDKAGTEEAKLPEIYQEYVRIKNNSTALLDPYEGGVMENGKYAPGKYYFRWQIDGEKPLPEFAEVETKMRTYSDARMSKIKVLLNPSTVTVKTKDGSQLTCRRGKPYKRQLWVNQKSVETDCELFLCDQNTLLHFESDPMRPVTNGTGTGGPFLFSTQDKNNAKSITISEINSDDGTFYKQNETHELLRSRMDLPESYKTFVESKGVRSFAPELQNIAYRKLIENLAYNCKEIEPAWSKLQAHYETVEAMIDRQSIVALVENVSGAMKIRLLPRAQLGTDVCQLEGDTYIRKELWDSRPKSLSPLPSDGALSEQEVQKIFKEVESMGDIAHEYSASGCEARAHLVAKRLQEKGYPVVKIWAKGGNLSPYKSWNDLWPNHVAAALPVKTATGKIEWRVLDPTLADHAVSTKDWLRRFQPTAGGNAVWTQWPLVAGSQSFSSGTFIYTTAPEIYDAREALVPDGETQKKDLATAQATNENMTRQLIAIQRDPKIAYKGHDVPLPLVERSAQP